MFLKCAQRDWSEQVHYNYFVKMRACIMGTIATTTVTPKKRRFKNQLVFFLTNIS